VPQADQVRTTRVASEDRSRAYDDLIFEHSRLNGVRADLVRAVVQVESAFDPNARSPKGAMGLMQLMPATMRQFGVKDAYNPVENVRAGVAYLRKLLDRYENNETLALAAYNNAGPGAVDKYDEKVPPYAETQNYVAKINKMVNGTIQRRNNTIYKTTEVVDGRVVTRYTDQKPTSGTYEVIGAR
jgi:soluble lytic murein transglycosylase-like protein